VPQQPNNTDCGAFEMNFVNTLISIDYSVLTLNQIYDALIHPDLFNLPSIAKGRGVTVRLLIQHLITVCERMQKSFPSSTELMSLSSLPSPSSNNNLLESSSTSSSPSSSSSSLSSSSNELMSLQSILNEDIPNVQAIASHLDRFSSDVIDDLNNIVSLSSSCANEEVKLAIISEIVLMRNHPSLSLLLKCVNVWKSTSTILKQQMVDVRIQLSASSSPFLRHFGESNFDVLFNDVQSSLTNEFVLLKYLHDDINDFMQLHINSLSAAIELARGWHLIRVHDASSTVAAIQNYLNDKHGNKKQIITAEMVAKIIKELKQRNK
jgi:hypothetical protein